MEQTLDNPSVFRECFKCTFKGETSETTCPSCGRKLYGPKEIRNRGIVQVLSGGFLVVFMGAIAFFVSSMLAGSMRDPANAKKIQEQASTFVVIYAIFGMVIVFGLHGLIMGIYQIATGRRSKVLIWIMWILMFGLLFVVGVFWSMSGTPK